jgi:hypothetical protein
MCVSVCVCVCDCLCVSMHYIIKIFCKYGNIMPNVSDYISPVHLHIILGDLAGATARVSGWGKTSDSKCNFLIISHFNLKNCIYHNGCFKRKKLMAFRKCCGHCE